MREYARIRGVNLNAVQTAIKSGRIHKTRDDKIDVDEANREWFMNTDPAQQRKPDPLFEAQGGVRMSNMGTFQQAKTADIYYRAMLAKAKLKMLTGEMVDRKRVGNYAFNLGRALRDLFMNLPVRYGGLNRRRTRNRRTPNLRNLGRVYPQNAHRKPGYFKQ